jgi:hypothetical protein
MGEFMPEYVDNNRAGQPEECDQPENRAQGEEPKLFACPKPLRYGRARKDSEKCLTENCADRQQKNREHKFYPARGHDQRVGRRNDCSRPGDIPDDLFRAARFPLSAIGGRSSLRCSQGHPQVTQIATNLEKEI